MTLPTIPLDVLENAARRADAYLMQYGLVASWSLHVFGLRFVAEYGSDKIEKTLDWRQIGQAKLPGELIHATERYALSGLSS